MYGVTPAFNDQVTAQERWIRGRVTVDYTDPFIDQSITVAASEQGTASWPAQTADSVETVPHKWASLDGSWVLDGTYHLAPGTAEEAEVLQMGWWGATLAGAGGTFAAPYPSLTVTFFARPIHSLRVVGDGARGEYPVDFTIRLYGAGDVLLHTENVVGNAAVSWSTALAASVNQVVTMVLEVSRWSHAGRQVKICEFFTSIQQTYEAADLVEITLLEEREVSQGSLPVGNISANEVTVRFDNSDRRFDADNVQSPLYGLLKPNRRVRVWIGAVMPDESVEWVPLGVFWSTEWKASEETVEAAVTAQDRMELLRKSTYQSAVVVVGATLYDLAVAVLEDAGLEPGEYVVDAALQDIVVPYAWFNPVPHREALRTIAEAALAVVYVGRDGVIRIEPRAQFAAPPADLTIGSDNYLRVSQPMRPDQVANEVIVDTQPLQPSVAAEEVYRSNNPIPVPAGQTVTVTVFYNSPPVIEAVASLVAPPAGVSMAGATYYGWGAEVTIQNTGGAPANVTLVVSGKPLQVRNKERAVARDADSQVEHGVLRYQFPENPLVQTLSVAQQIADALLASAKDSRRDIEVDWRGNPALLLGDLVSVKGQDYQVIRQDLTWAGYLEAKLTGRRAT